jgi:hypothetical protein
MWFLLACAGEKDPVETTWSSLYDDDPLNPFPSAELVADGHVAIPEGALPVPEGGTALPLDRVSWRTGYSPVQPSVWRPYEALDADSVGGQLTLGIGGPVRMVDLDSGEEIPCFAELDAHPDAVASGIRSMIVRPMTAMTAGHTVAVVVTSAVRGTGGALSTSPWEQAVASDAHYAALADDLAALGFDDVVLAWDFPVSAGTEVLDAVLADVGVPTTWDLGEARTDGLPEGVLAVAEGTLDTPSWLVDDTSFEVVDGLPVLQGTTGAYLYAWMPAIAATTTDPLPVLVFGHGILEDPAHYLEDDADASAVIDVANRLGAIVVASVWRGLTKDDLIDAVNVANDFGTFPSLTDRMTQGVANTAALVRAVDEGELLDDPFFAGRADRTRLWYYGISLGSIEGAVLLANQDAVDRAVLHVGGSDWSTMLERSSNWPPFEAALVRTVPDPADRQLLYAVSQLLWDPVDPAIHAERLRGRPILWQESIGDNQVPNLTTELLMRAAGVPLGTPAFTSPFGLETVALPTSAPVMVQMDPQLGVPDPVNRPAAETGAHATPRTWEGVKQQTVTFFQEGMVVNFCGDTGCDASHTGAE